MPKRPGDNKDGGDLGTIVRPELDRETDTKKKVERPSLYEVLLHNDDYTTQEFVVYVLMKYFQHDGTAARKIMLHVHTKGVGVAGVFPFEIAETKAHQVVAFARENEMPLQASIRKSPET
ncbi:MAG TPA: ATP-dependent Clp protease adaptor ClpS [Polyangia bacterium]|jgi:ATP-dependent Clp protease adaptor protein ClpS|nr:ATP-dependent Clp protease adaptor ClpS [Polyangia bacterium]